jgi:hypothetical protein
VAAGAAILLVDLAKDPHGGEKVQYLLVGNLVWVSWREVIKITCVCAGVGLFHFICRRQFNLVTFHPKRAEEEGVSIRLWDFLFYLSFGLAITSIVRITGVLLIFSYLIIPATIGTLYAERIRSRVLIGWGLGFGVSFLGLLLSYDRPSGPMIVSIFGLSLIVLGGARFLICSKEKKRAAALLGGISAALLFLLFGLPALTSPSSEDHESREHETHESEHQPKVSEARPADTGEFKNLESADSVIREAAIDDLSKRSDAAALDALASVLKQETDDGLKLKLALILQGHNRDDGLRALISLLRESEIPFVRMEAIHHLEEIAGEKFGYNAMQSATDNAEAIKKMQRWMESLKAWDSIKRHEDEAD